MAYQLRMYACMYASGWFSAVYVCSLICCVTETELVIYCRRVLNLVLSTELIQLIGLCRELQSRRFERQPFIRANARNITFVILYGGKFSLSSQITLGII